VGAMRKAYEVVEPGVRECDAAAAIQATQYAGSPDFAGDFTALPPIIMAGENAAAPHLMWSDRKYTPGETISLELAGAYRHYTAGLARTMQLGSKPKKVADVETAVLEGIDAVLQTIAPGVVAQDVEAAWRKVIARHGFKKESRIGYSIGIGYPPDWGEHTISLRQGDMTVLQPGNTLHSIMGMWMDGWGIEISETILVTRNGCETLTKLPRQIHQKR
jgi:ectoine hydrolase